LQPLALLQRQIEVNDGFFSLFSDQPPPKTPPKAIPLTRTYSNLKLVNGSDDEPEETMASLKITLPLEAELKCPTEREAKFELFPLVCNKNQDCSQLGKAFRCCKLFGGTRCHEGYEVPLEDIEHERELLEKIKNNSKNKEKI
jgi:hypothetical protein